MARAVGQIDVAKSQAILDAAVDVMAEKGLGASMEEVARRAGVSKQTIYNHYRSKDELIRIIAARRAEEIAATLDAPEALEDPRGALAAYARVLLGALLNPKGTALFRMAMLGADSMPEIA
ncbi:MAG TPA: helix-turn-helix domain-containing protein, partial [Phenylobacterium sp.]